MILEVIRLQTKKNISEREFISINPLTASIPNIYKIGRDSTNEIQITDASVSR
jgi:pSer/pThr/pTyr-binding forkhead associated (FHA) protein